MSQQNTSSDMYFLAGTLAVAAGAVATVAFWVVGGVGSLVGAVFGAAVLLVSLVVLCLLLPTLASGEMRGAGNLPVDVDAKRAEANRAGQAPTSGAAVAAAAPAAPASAVEKPAPVEAPAPRAAEEEVAPVAEAAPAPVVEEPAPAVDAETVAEMSDADRPEALTEAREGGADDLKRIKGVGPKMEALLNSMGFYHFDQIAAWTDREVAWVDDNLEGFKGRVTRDEWVAQAKQFAAEDNAG
ncbi:NADH:ubiquinone oxidoreductase [Pontivivens insulae]|uniref:50S ribosomal protein L21 n=1 Tax=Pontivivens insulae TaxID=1639689 RepID=A0A2R8ACV2_9RHOB|nr:NADH:ubiquinone oxidoreductase [Pontivivens insulae]RED13794.1 putative flap endonuclease-1-like 5' DNA nuclease [Pontivivens insulae]SPF29868.1 50S ribosomal protein L21 [Pontivivens insulae]